MARPKSDGATDTSSASRNRFVVSLPNELGGKVDKVGERLTASVRQQTGIGVTLSRAQIIQSLVESALHDANGASAEAEVGATAT